jgi:glycosyltransferase involved in cell wall biosynthesis
MDAHIAVSGSVADHVSHHLGLRQARVILNPLETYVLDTPTRETDHDTGERQRTSVCDPPLVACPATLRVEKNHYLLLRAAAQAKRAGTPTRLVLAGDGPLRQSLEAEVARLHLTSDVRLIGRLEHRALIALVRRADLVALSSCAEGGPIAILEAMAQGTAVLSTAVGCLPDVVDHGVSGILVPVGDDDAFCAEFLRLAQDARLRESLGAAGRGSVAARSAPEVVAARHDEVYRLARQIGADQC